MNSETKNDSLVILDTRLMEGTSGERRYFTEALIESCRNAGVFYLRDSLTTSKICGDVLDAGREFFNLPPDEKEAVHIRHSKHFRGYSQMKNERDWREQFHLGMELMPLDSGAEVYWQLRGENLFPARLGEKWQNLMLTYMSSGGNLAHRLLSALALALELPKNYFDLQAQNEPYLLMKLISYYPQAFGRDSKSGVAAHCDWSWLTFLLQDEAGLEVKIRSGQWVSVPPIEDLLVVNIGELLEILTNGYFYAAPHRVINSSLERPRLSVPVFINPALPSIVETVKTPEYLLTKSKYDLTTPSLNNDSEHVHRVAELPQRLKPFVFGDSEWQRKGIGQWCYRKECL